MMDYEYNKFALMVMLFELSAAQIKIIYIGGGLP